MQHVNRSLRTFVALLLVTLGLTVAAPRLGARQAAQPQVTTTNIARPASAPPISFSGPETETTLLRQQIEQAKLAMDERHKRMVSDADKLLALATALKSEVDKSTKYETSAAAVRRAAEIEKLAHDVKDRMRN